MDVNKIINEVEDSAEYKKLGSGYYLVHVFRMMDANKSVECQAGYYNKKIDKIVVFDYNQGNVTVSPAEEAFKEKKIIPPLDLKKVKVGMDEALKKTDQLVKDNYPAQMLTSAIILLQNLPEYGIIWNMTVVTHTFNVINIKINAGSGEIIKHTLETLLGWEKK